MYRDKKKVKLCGWPVAGIFAAVALLAAGCEEMDDWELASVRVSSPDVGTTGYVELPYHEGSFTVNVESNTDWTANAPDWMTVTPSSGTGNATLTVTYQMTDEYTSRRNTVSVVAGRQGEPLGNVVDTNTGSVTIRQEGLEDVATFRVSGVDITHTIWRENGEMYSDYDGTIEYQISADVSDEALARAFEGTDLVIREFLFYDRGRELFRAPVTLTKGTHTMTVDVDASSIHLYSGGVLTHTAEIVFINRAAESPSDILGAAYHNFTFENIYK